MTARIKCFCYLVKKELDFFFRKFPSRLLDISAMLATWIIVFGYFMVNSGLSNSYSSFILVASIATFGLSETLWRATRLSQEITDGKIASYLILPIRSLFVFVAIALSWSICTAILSIMLFPLGKLILWEKFDLSEMSTYKFILIFLSSSLFYGFFALWIASLVKNLRSSTWLWARVVNPLYMFCGFFYTWEAAYAIAPWIGCLHLFNPLIYVTEGMKASVFGQRGFLPYWMCLGAIWFFLVFFAFDALRRLKNRIDFV